MHLALPARKNSNPTPYTHRTSRLPSFRKGRLQFLGLCALGIGSVIFIISRLFGASERVPFGTPSVVIITVLDYEYYPEKYLGNVIENRQEYAKLHGYATFFANTTSYALDGSPGTWARVPAMRHAMAQFPHAKYLWFLDQHTLIMNPVLDVERHIADPTKLDSMMMKDKSVIPPDSVVKTFSHLRGSEIELVLTQDNQGLSQSSFVLKRGEWAKYFLDAWFDPLYRSYNFQKADTHALEHIVQWHPTILSKLALVPQRTMNSFSTDSRASPDGVYKDGDFVIRFEGCEWGGDRDCEREAEPFVRQWKTSIHALR